MMELSHRWASVLLIALVAVVSAIYLTTGLRAARGRFVAPLDDAYITFQYARQVARGHLYRYNGGDAPTTGMTSPLFGFLLAGTYLLGFTGERIVAFAVGMGIVWLGLIGWLTYRITSHLVDREGWDQRWALAAMALVLLTGSVQWGCFNGMETGFFAVLTLAALNAFLADRAGSCAFWLALAGLTRTEGLILAGPIWAVTLAENLLGDRVVHWRRLIPPTAAIVVGFIPFLINWTLTGTPSAAGLRAKSWLLNVPFYPEDIIRSVLHSYRRVILGRFLRGQQWFVPPGVLLLSLLGWVALGIRRHWMRLSMTLSWFLVGTLSTATLITATWHMGRYQVPFVPVTIVLTTVGLAFLCERARKRWQRVLVGATSLYLLVSSSYSALYYAKRYHLAVSTTVRQQLTMADWLGKNLPSDVRVGVHDVGSLRYIGKRPTYDLIGLTTPDAAIAWRHGAGSVFEKMEHSPMRPDYFAIYPDVFSIPYLAETDLFAKELFRVEVPDYAVASAGPVQGVWRADWHLAGSGEDFYQSDVVTRTAGFEIVDTLDVANLDDEAAHNVEWWQDARRPGFPTEVQQLRYRVPPEREVLDGGRLLTGGMTFDVNTKPGKPLWIVARLHAREAGAVRVEADGQGIGRWAYPPVPGQWLETVFRIPSEKIAHARTQIVLRVDAENPDFRHYAPYYFWFLQGEPEQRPVSIEHRVHATFAENLSLLGFDLPHKSWRPGDVVPVTLYWQAAASSESNAKAFLHLYDTEGKLGPQADGWAYYGTRPPYTWRSGEVVVDPRQIPLSGDLPRGTYSLEVGLYDPDSLERLPAYRDGIHQPEGRVPLATIEVNE